MQLAAVSRGVRRLITHDRQFGWTSATQMLARKLRRPAPDAFDRARQTDTGWLLPLCQVLNVPQGAHYSTWSEEHLRAALDPLPRHVTFVDLGCGKGRVLIVAAEMGFRAVVGVELVPMFAALARSNLRRCRLRASVIRADAAHYDLPAGPVAIYLNNPFGTTVMTAVCDRLRRRTEETWIVYATPMCGSLFTDWTAESVPTPAQRALFGAALRVFHRPAAGC